MRPGAFPIRAQQDGSCKEGWQKGGHSALNKAATRECTISIHQHNRGVGFKKCATQGASGWLSGLIFYL